MCSVAVSTLHMAPCAPTLDKLAPCRDSSGKKYHIDFWSPSYGLASDVSGMSKNYNAKITGIAGMTCTFHTLRKASPPPPRPVSTATCSARFVRAGFRYPAPSAITLRFTVSLRATSIPDVYDAISASSNSTVVVRTEDANGANENTYYLSLLPLSKWTGCRPLPALCAEPSVGGLACYSSRWCWPVQTMPLRGIGKAILSYELQLHYCPEVKPNCISLLLHAIRTEPPADPCT